VSKKTGGAIQKRLGYLSPAVFEKKYYREPKAVYKPSQKKDFGTESRHIRVENRRHTGV
jgi:hypothetical protein